MKKGIRGGKHGKKFFIKMSGGKLLIPLDCLIIVRMSLIPTLYTSTTFFYHTTYSYIFLCLFMSYLLTQVEGIKTNVINYACWAYSDGLPPGFSPRRIHFYVSSSLMSSNLMWSLPLHLLVTLHLASSSYMTHTQPYIQHQDVHGLRSLSYIPLSIISS